MGKATNKDAGKGKNTYPVLLGLEESKLEAHRQLQMAIDSLKPLGDGAGRLITLAKFVVEREA
jgi:geranylgeranyl pyrophosphate synthase